MALPRKKTLVDAALESLGYDGSKISPGQLDRQEWHRELSSPLTKQKLFREILENNPDVMRGFRLPVDLLTAGKWRIRPPKGMGKDKRALEVAAFLQGVIDDSATPLYDMIDDLLSALPWGYAVSEIIWKRRNGRNNAQPSAHNDGLWGIHKIELRPQYTAYGWAKDNETGEIVAFIQRDPQTGALAYIPLIKALHLTLGAGTTGPEGKAGLRNVFIPCRNKRRLTEIIHIGEEHTKAGVFVMEAPSEILKRAAANDADAATMVEDTVQGMAQISTGERACIVMPSRTNPDNTPSGWRLEMLSTTGSSKGDAIEMIRMHREDIAIGIGITFLLLGMNGSGGSKGQSEDQTSLAATIMQGLGDRVGDVFTRQLFPRIVAMNGMDPAYSSTMTYTHPRKVDLTGLAQLIGVAQTAGIPLVDAADADELRERAGLSPRTAE